VFAQNATTAAQNPWPIKKFFIDPDMHLSTNLKSTLQADFEHAADWYEKMKFKSPELDTCVTGKPKTDNTLKCGPGPITTSCSAGKKNKYFIFGQKHGLNHIGYAIIAAEPSWDTNKKKPNGCLDKSEWDARDTAKGNCGKEWTAPGGYNNRDAIYFNGGDFSSQGMMRQANLPAHELFHAVAYAYPGYRGWFDAGGSKAGWLVEGLPDAMAWEWMRFGKYKKSVSEKDILELNDPDPQKGFRFYDYPLHKPLDFGQNKPPCGSDRKHLRKQEYRTWSFWRFLGRQKAKDYKLIRGILEATRGWDNLGLFVVDEGLRNATWNRCSKRPKGDKKKPKGEKEKKFEDEYLPSLPEKKLKKEGINCDTARTYGGLYYFYPKFIAEWTETVRKYEDGLDLTFSDKQRPDPQLSSRLTLWLHIVCR
jgi:hypothetical protein